MAQLTIGATTMYRCFYVATRVEYSATEVTTPASPRTTFTRRKTPDESTIVR